jgi:hypothetical protein
VVDPLGEVAERIEGVLQILHVERLRRARSANPVQAPRLGTVGVSRVDLIAECDVGDRRRLVVELPVEVLCTFSDFAKKA